MEDRIRNEVEIHSQLTHSAILKVSISLEASIISHLLPPHITPITPFPHPPSLSPSSYMMSLKMMNTSTWYWSYAKREISTNILELKSNSPKVMVSNQVACLV